MSPPPWYSDEETSEMDLRYSRQRDRGPSPSPARYAPSAVDSRQGQPQPRYVDARPRFEDALRGPPAVERTTIVATRRSRSRSRHRGRSSSSSSGSSSSSRSPARLPAGAIPPVVINNNRFYKHSDSESEGGHSRAPNRHQPARNASRDPPRGHSRNSSTFSNEREREQTALVLQKKQLEFERDIDDERRQREWEQRERDIRERELREENAMTLHKARLDYEHEIENERRLRARERDDAQKQYELERAQKELEELKLVAKIEKEEKHRERTTREDRELRDAKKELDAIRAKKEQDGLERRMKEKFELDRIKAEEAALSDKKFREKVAYDAIEDYKRKEADRIQKEKDIAQAKDKEYKQLLQKHLLDSGLGEGEISAILEGRRIEKKKEKEVVKVKETEKVNVKEKEVVKEVVQASAAQVHIQNVYEERSRPTYTRMARRHLSLETLRAYNIDFSIDQDPDFVVIKRWVPEPEQDILWRHTRMIREERSGSTTSSSKIVLAVEGKKHHHHHSHSHSSHLDPEFEWVRKKERRKSRSRSPAPALLTYLAGGRPGY